MNSISNEQSSLYHLYKNMTPGERLIKGFELSQWAISINKNYKQLLAERIVSTFVLE